MKKNLLPGSGMFLLCLFTLNITAQNFSLVKDFNTSKDGNPSNNIYNLYIGFKNNNFFFGLTGNSSFALFKGVAYFSADDGIHGTELWRSDNTAAGTYMVKDINPGSASSSIQSITVVGNKLFFTADRIVYISDGTATGTVPVPGISYTGDVTTCLTPVGNTLYFFTNISRLWKTDGTAAGTSLVVDFRTKYNGSKDFLGQLTNVNGTLFFTTGTDYTNGVELWKSDGTEAGTVMVKDINPGLPDSRPVRLTPLNGKLYFVADDGTGIHLWVSDGSETGTQPVTNSTGAVLQQADINGNLDLAPITSIANVLYFKAGIPTTGNELYKYDVTKPSTGIVLLKDIFTGSKSSDPSNLTAVDNTLYFSVSDENNQQELWKSDGTKSNTVLVKDLGPGLPKYVSGAVNANGKLLFSFYTINNGYELWSSDGTGNGTKQVKNIYAGNHSSLPTGITYFKNGVSLFSATDGIKGTELWRTDGSSSGTELIKNINNNTTAGFNPDLYSPIFFDNKLFFTAYTPAYGNNLYSSDGTAGGTQLVKDINYGNSSNPANFTIFKNNLYFSADSAGYNSIYKTDGTAPGTIKIFSLEKADAYVQRITAAKNYLYIFYNNKDADKVELWASDGTTAGFHKIQDLPSESGTLAIGIDNTLYFRGFDSINGYELWKSTNTAGSAKLIRDIYPGLASSYPDNFIAYNNKLYFHATDSANANFIFVSDGTKAGTKRISQGRGPITEANNKLFFSGFNGAAGDELFISNGTATGTNLLKDINAGPLSSNPNAFTVLNNVVYFTASDDIHGNELWKSNGTTKGTVLVKDIFPGVQGSNPNRFTIADNQLYFWVTDSLYQNRLFVSNGKSSGTKEVNDGGLAGVNITGFAGAGDKLLVNGYTYDSGNELYAGISQDFAAVAKSSLSNNAINKQSFTATIIGNPVQDALKLFISTANKQAVQITISDAGGKTYINRREALSTGSNLFSFPVGFCSQGIYIVNIIAEDNSSAQLKFVK